MANASKGTVLVIDDEKDLVELLRYSLEKDGFDAIAAGNGESGIEIALQHKPDVVLLDLMLPGIDGFEVCRRLRADKRTRNVPIIMLTAKAEEMDRVIGLELGADDYQTKPFSPRELLARIKSVLRRASSQDEPQEVLRAGELTIDLARHEVTCGGGVVDVTATEFRILEFLVGHLGRVYSRNEIIDSALGRDTAIMERTIDVHITALRRKLGAFGENLKTLRGVGYKVEAAEPRTLPRANTEPLRT